MYAKALKILAVSGFLLASGCANCGTASEPEASNEVEATASVIAEIGDASITAEQFQAYLDHKRIVIRSEAQLDEELDRFVRREALAQAAGTQEILDPAELEAELAEFRRQTAQARYFERYLRGAVTQQDVEAYYTEHAADYETKRVRVAHILVRSKRRSADEARAAAKQKINDAHAQLEDGKDFAEIAKTFSDDQVSATRGGDMGWVREGAIDKKFSEVAFELEAGAFSEPIETPFGYQIVKVLEGPEVRKKPLSSVEGDIRHKLRGEAKAAEVARLESLVTTNVDRGDWRPKSLVAAPAVANVNPAALPLPAATAKPTAKATTKPTAAPAAAPTPVDPPVVVQPAGVDSPKVKSDAPVKGTPSPQGAAPGAKPDAVAKDAGDGS